MFLDPFFTCLTVEILFYFAFYKRWKLLFMMSLGSVYWFQRRCAMCLSTCLKDDHANILSVDCFCSSRQTVRKSDMTATWHWPLFQTDKTSKLMVIDRLWTVMFAWWCMTWQMQWSSKPHGKNVYFTIWKQSLFTQAYWQLAVSYICHFLIAIWTLYELTRKMFRSLGYLMFLDNEYIIDHK